jgi:hypothetical protein
MEKKEKRVYHTAVEQRMIMKEILTEMRSRCLTPVLEKVVFASTKSKEEDIFQDYKIGKAYVHGIFHNIKVLGRVDDKKVQWIGPLGDISDAVVESVFTEKDRLKKTKKSETTEKSDEETPSAKEQQTDVDQYANNEWKTIKPHKKSVNNVKRILLQGYLNTFNEPLPLDDVFKNNSVNLLKDLKVGWAFTYKFMLGEKVMILVKENKVNLYKIPDEITYEKSLELAQKVGYIQKLNKIKSDKKKAEEANKIEEAKKAEEQQSNVVTESVVKESETPTNNSNQANFQEILLEIKNQISNMMANEIRIVAKNQKILSQNQIRLGNMQTTLNKNQSDIYKKLLENQKKNEELLDKVNSVVDNLRENVILFDKSVEKLCVVIKEK